MIGSSGILWGLKFLKPESDGESVGIVRYVSQVQNAPNNVHNTAQVVTGSGGHRCHVSFVLPNRASLLVRVIPSTTRTVLSYSSTALPSHVKRDYRACEETITIQAEGEAPGTVEG